MREFIATIRQLNLLIKTIAELQSFSLGMLISLSSITLFSHL
ncbi:hypothetical protein X975_04719, partial [Stegodyphus mimosarum]